MEIALKTMTTIPHNPHRESTIDALRGIAVLGMIIAHAIFFFHTQTNTFLNSLELFANTIILTLFVFISGSSYSKTLDSHAHSSKKDQIKRILIYSGFAYLAYVIVSIVGVLTTLDSITSQAVFQKILGILFFTAPTNFTEYMTLFIFFPLSGIVFHSLYKNIRTSLFWTILVGILLYALGVLLYPLTFVYPFNEFKELLAGGNDLLRFPILFYYPIYLFGLWWEYQLTHSEVREIKRTHIIFVISTTALLLFGIVLSRQIDIPLLSVFVRWPPSIGFLLTGLTASTLLSIIINSLHPESWIRYIYRYMTYLGRDALDLWITHLLILLIYKRFIGTQFGDIGTVSFLVAFTIILSTLASSIRMTNTISLTHIGTISYIPVVPTKFRKRYILFLSIIASFIVFSLTQQTPQSLFGEKLPQQTLSVYDQLPTQATAHLSSNRLWSIRSGPWEKPIQLTLQILDDSTKKQFSVNPSQIKFISNDMPLPFHLKETTNKTLIYELSPSSISAGKYFVTAVISSPYKTIYSNIVPIMNSEPMIIAWTFDWEGWDASDETLSQISSLSAQFGDIPFTQFVNPRTFITETISQERKDAIQKFLKTRASKGDEIALHIHMQYDMVENAGVPANTTTHWGLLSQEGYDVPTTAYSTEDFEKIVTAGLTILENIGLPKPTGYRAGGWFINDKQLETLKTLGFSYDTSGRDRPAKGAFSSIPWRLPIGAQPYYPNPSNQNKAQATSSGILEIPNNGVTTYESSPAELLVRAKTLYGGGALTKPTTLVITSHPQFSQTEFPKIPAVLTQLENYSQSKDSGPVVFGTMDSIYSLWTSSIR
jgi:hypothetical protein